MKLISFSLFSHNDDIKSFETFLEYFSINIRAYKVLFPSWKIYLHLEDKMYDLYKEYFDFLKENDIIDFSIKKGKTLCENMLWRMETIGDYVISRDVDSLPTYRERQAVEIWIRNNTLMHSISDNKEHNAIFMGGMIGYKRNTFDISKDLKTAIKNTNIDFKIKGSDQVFLGKTFQKVFHIDNGLTHHILKEGLTIEKIKWQIEDNSKILKLQYLYNYIEDINIEDIDVSLKKTNEFNYIGKAMQDYTEQEKIDIYNFYINNVDESLNKKLLEIESSMSVFKNYF